MRQGAALDTQPLLPHGARALSPVAALSQVLLQLRNANLQLLLETFARLPLRMGGLLSPFVPSINPPLVRKLHSLASRKRST